MVVWEVTGRILIPFWKVDSVEVVVPAPAVVEEAVIPVVVEVPTM